MRTLQSFVTAKQRENHRLKMARWREAKRLKRESSDEPVREEWRGKFVLTLTVHNRLTGTMHALDERGAGRNPKSHASLQLLRPMSPPKK